MESRNNWKKVYVFIRVGYKEWGNAVERLRDCSYAQYCEWLSGKNDTTRLSTALTHSSDLDTG